MKLTLRARLTLMYSGIVALTIASFAAVAYVTVSNQLKRSLDTSLARVATSLHAVIRREQRAMQRPLLPSRKERRRDTDGRGDALEFFVKRSLQELVGPILPSDTVADADPVWAAVYEHMLINSSAYLIQVTDRSGRVVWKSDNLRRDSLPVVRTFERHGASFEDGRIFTNYTLGGIRYRMILSRGDVAEITTAYPASEVDATLRQLFAALLWSVPVSLAVSLVAGWYLARRSLKPVDDITTSARRITAQNLAQRLPTPTTNDEIARLTATLNEMIARLETSFERTRQFTSDASHELKTPLAILLGELEIALRRPLTSEEYRATIISCLEEVERLTAVVEGLLELSRADAGQVGRRFEQVRFSRLVEEICDDVQILADAKRITVITNVQPDIQLDGDPVRLHQALLNVIENAVKYTQEAGRVDVTMTADQRKVAVIVSDTGIGIDADDIPFIFDRFYRVDKARSQRVRGTGLGLAIAKWVVDAHDGTITVNSTPGMGSTFTITLPLRHGTVTS